MHYAQALGEATDPRLGTLRAFIHALRGESFWLAGHSDSAIAEIRVALSEQQRTEDATLVRLY